MPEAKPEPSYEDETPTDPDATDLDALKIRQDVDGILGLAKLYRSGGPGVPRDMKKCFEAYKVAAELGSAEADYAVALFHLTGGVIPQDLKEGATRLRTAAEKGSVPAKVYLGNLYELGIHYKADREKADVWYRNAARGAGVESDDKPALAELGCVRYVLELADNTLLDDAEKQRLMARAKAHGYQLKMRAGTENIGVTTDPAIDRPTLTAALAADSMLPDAKAKPAKKANPDAAAETVKISALGPTQASLALGAFGFALLWVLAGTGAGYAATHGARELIAQGHPLPLLGTKLQFVFPIVGTVFGLIPAGFAYKFSAWFKALLVGGAAGGAGWVAWGTGMAALHASRVIQATAFGIVGFLLGLLVFGLLGGTKKQPPRVPKKKA